MTGRRRKLSFPRPEDAALAGWPRAANPRVVSSSVLGRRAEVHLTVNDHYDYWVYCVKEEEGWRVVVDGDGPVVEWEDVTAIDWEMEDT